MFIYALLCIIVFLTYFLPLFSARYEHNATSAMENVSMNTNQFCHFIFDNTSRTIVFIVFYITIIITSIPSNTFSLYVAWKHIKQKNELGVYMFSLALSDLSFTFSLTLWIDFLWKQVWVHGGYVCLLSINVILTNLYTSEALLCCISLNRYLAVVHPFKYPFLRKIGTAAAISIAIWVVVVCFNTTTTTSWMSSYYEMNEVTVCFDYQFLMSKHLKGINIARFFLGFIFPVLLVLFSTWGICEAVESNQATEEQERKQIWKLLTVVLLCLVICYGPFHVIILLHALQNENKRPGWMFYIEKISIATSSLTCLVDPLIYCFITRSGKANVNQVVLFFQAKRRSKDEVVV